MNNWLLSGVHCTRRLAWIGLLAALAACSTPPLPTTTAPSIPALQVHADQSAEPGKTDAPPAPILEQFASNAEPAGLTVELVPIPVSSSFPQVEWSSVPDCSNQPLTAGEWKGLLANQPSGAGAALFLQENAQDALMESTPAQSELAALTMNVASGRLNRETGIEIAGLPDLHTVGELMNQLEGTAAGEETLPALIQASQQVQLGNGITQPVCARLLVTQMDNQPAAILWSNAGIQADVPRAAAMIDNGSAVPGPVKDSGIASPDGKKAAFTSLQPETGGPVFLLDLETGEWTNLIRAINARIKGSRPALPEDLWWEIAGWLPDNQRLMLAPADLSSVYLVDTSNYSYQTYVFDGGLGGASAVQLSPDGSRFVYFGLDPSGGQSLNTVDLKSGQTAILGVLPAEEGFMLYPRFSPDGLYLAFLVQIGHPLSGMTYSINLYSFADGSERILVQGNLGPTVPVWSPDGKHIAFTRKELDEPDIVIPDQIPPPMRGNIWMVSVQDSALTQLTFINGWARSPAWDFDAQTLAFVTHDGQVGLVNIDQPGKIWRAADISTSNPLVTSAFFVP
jgi:Tol biopolymer transport system component